MSPITSLLLGCTFKSIPNEDTYHPIYKPKSKEPYSYYFFKKIFHVCSVLVRIAQKNNMLTILHSMCTAHVSMKIYRCGDRIRQDVKLEPCPNIGTPLCPGRSENHLASKRVKGKCRRHDCNNP